MPITVKAKLITNQEQHNSLLKTMEILRVLVKLIDSHYTSQQCSVCGFTNKGNRKTQDSFSCLECGHTENADYNASKNIAFRAVVNPPIVLC